MGDQTQQRDPEGRISQFTYDLCRHQLTRSNGENETETYSYDNNGNRVSLTRPKGNQTTYQYDGADRLIQVTDALSGITKYSYDNNGNQLTQTDAEKNTTTFGYDALNRRTSIDYADGNHASFGYDANGNQTSMTNANGQSFTKTYDVLNRLTQTDYPVSGSDDLQSIVNDYDENNNRVKVTETYSGSTGTRVTSQSFDAFDRLINKTDPEGKSIRYSYDANGNRKTVTDPDNLVTQYHYDELNRVSQVINAAGITEYQYDRSSLKTQVKYPNGSSMKQSYDGAGRITEIVNQQGLAAISSFIYEYDDNGNRTQQIETNGQSAETISYQFDDNDRLIEAAYPDQTTSYGYDAAYNRISEQTTQNIDSTITVDKTLKYNKRNQVTEVTDNLDAAHSASYVHDKNGNRISRTEGSLTSNFIYDSRDQLREITSGGSSIGQFLYDYQGLRIRKQTPGETLRYVYDDQSVLIQTDDSGNTISKYDYGPDRLLSLNNTTEGTQFYLFDALGSVVNLTKPDTSIQTRIQYDAWGNVRNQVGSSENEFGFTGHEMDEESGLIYMKARFYDPVLGQFLNQDSFEGTADMPPSLHKYLYAAGNPVIFVDTNGHFFILGDMADQLAQKRNRTLDAASSLSNRGALRGAQRVSAGFAGIGAGVYGLLEGGLRTLNYAGNLAVEGMVRTTQFASSLAGIENSGNALSENYFIKSAREEFSASNAAIGKAYETIKEHPGEVGAAIVNSVVETGAGIIEGDPGAIARGTSTLTETVGGGGIAGVGAKVGKQLLITAGKGVKKVAEKTGDIAKKAIENLGSGPMPGSLKAQLGAIGVKGKASSASESKTLTEWLKDNPGLLDEATSQYKSKPQWQGIDPETTPVKYVPKSEVDKIRKVKGESGGHHPHGLALGGPKGQKLTITNETRKIKNPDHTEATTLQRKIIREIKKQM